MIGFSPLGKNVNLIKEYLEASQIKFCDLSLGAKYLWRDEFKIDYAIVNQTLILKETSRDYKDAFYFPMGKDVLGALEKIENYAREKHVPLKFCCIDNDTCSYLAKRYREIEISNDRDWSDYIYLASAFKTYSGKKLSGQRNHVNKFRRNYPNYSFNVMTEGDVAEVKSFLEEFNRGKDFSLWTELAEIEKLDDYVESAFEIGQVGGILRVSEKIVGITLGEIVGDTLIIHVEKALREFEGAYPTLASEFAKAVCVDKVKYINREEDCGDAGLRISKLQYHPVEIKQKNIVNVKTLITEIKEPFFIKTERLTITEIKEQDKDVYYELYVNDELNKYWGYDYREELNGAIPSPEYFYNFQKKMKQTLEEFSFAVRANGEMVGELVFHNFNHFGGLEIGYRFLANHQRKGYAFEGATALINYAKETLKASEIYTRCDIRNNPSHNLILKLGFKEYMKSETHFYFKQKLN